MCCLKLPIVLVVLSGALNCLQAAPTNRFLALATGSDQANGPSPRRGWIFPVLSNNTLLGFTSSIPGEDIAKMKSHPIEKRKCNTATCVTQRLADFLIRANGNMRALHSPTNVGAYTYGKRDSVGPLSREPFNHVQI
ncbi:islet amyloid polypeptide [Latimeria chalumnae]|uniref:Islet amyloid polypeptide n=1 Tax=Latimeria chalumnae TaxID=7897 RepID=H3AWW1_LATCH|nr:PREDICTED: islet amyloid polypeptide [Latimeria chalumnae]XP_005998925.1 PREDICTED: islet amyloid polypeptide [Latimeria chalumnae]|eukprot:XP_005998924.1 PREDICTED: islet amyloid polypeptide [Latimeria chalumnae]